MSLQLKRNDSCHCDSGKKYKNCHGKEGGKKSYPWTLWAVITILIAVFSFIPNINQSDNSLVSKPYVPSAFKSANSNSKNPPPGKVWSEAHGHWHDINDGSHASHSKGSNISDNNTKKPPSDKVRSKKNINSYNVNEK